jgi:hypothetical protein
VPGVKRLSECGGRELMWSQRSAFSGDSELHDGDELCARLEWSFGFGSRIEGETEEGRWRFRRRGFLSGTIEAYASGSDTPEVTCRSKWRGGALRFASGRELTWRHVSLWKRTWRFETTAGEPLLGLRGRPAFFKTRATLAIEPAALRDPDLSLLALLGWYLLLRERRSSHAH